MVPSIPAGARGLSWTDHHGSRCVVRR